MFGNAIYMVIYRKGGSYMWTRESIKTYAKGFLKEHYWKAFVVCLIFTIITGSHFSESSGARNDYYNDPNISFEEMIEYRKIVPIETGYKGVNFFLDKIGLIPLTHIGWGMFFSIFAISILLSITLGSLVSVGKNRFFLNGFKGDVDIRYLFSTFNKSEFWGIFKCMFVTGFFNFLWFLLFIIPGIMKAYEYYFVPYLLTENPNLTAGEAIAISREMTDDQKWNMFVLDLSFLGWRILGALFFGIGGIFVTPYYEATYARLYNVLSGNDDSLDSIITDGI